MPAAASPSHCKYCISACIMFAKIFKILWLYKQLKVKLWAWPSYRASLARKMAAHTSCSKKMTSSATGDGNSRWQCLQLLLLMTADATAGVKFNVGDPVIVIQMHAQSLFISLSPVCSAAAPLDKLWYFSNHQLPAVLWSSLQRRLHFKGLSVKSGWVVFP